MPRARQWGPPKQRGLLPAPCASLALQGASGGAAFGGVACGPGGVPPAAWPAGWGNGLSGLAECLRRRGLRAGNGLSGLAEYLRRRGLRAGDGTASWWWGVPVELLCG